VGRGNFFLQKTGCGVIWVEKRWSSIWINLQITSTCTLILILGLVFGKTRQTRENLQIFSCLPLFPNTKPVTNDYETGLNLAFFPQHIAVESLSFPTTIFARYLTSSFSLLYLSL